MKKNLYWMAAAFITLTAVGCTNAKKANVSAGNQFTHRWRNRIGDNSCHSYQKCFSKEKRIKTKYKTDGTLLSGNTKSDKRTG